MNEITCFQSCPMKLDLQNSKDKMAFLQEYWSHFGEMGEMINLSKSELICHMCLLNVLLDAIAKKEFICPKEKTVELVKTRLYILLLL